MRDGRSKTAPIINHRMIHSIVPSPSVRSSVPPQNQIPERKLELSRKRSPLLPGESLPRPCEGGNLSPLEPSPPPPPDSPYPALFSHARDPPSPLPQTIPHIHLHSWTSHRFHPRPFVLPLLDAAPLQIAPISRAVNFIFPRHFSLDVVLRRTASTPYPNSTVYRYLRNYRLNFMAILELCMFPWIFFKKGARVIFLLPRNF